jgi:hypothetical protein
VNPVEDQGRIRQTTKNNYMSDIKDKIIEAAENDPDNWITRKCVVCNTAVRINFKLDPASADPDEPFTCSECLNKD